MTKSFLAAALALALGAPALAQTRYTQEEIVAKIGACMKENAPEDWQRMIFSMDEGKAPIHEVVAKSSGAKPHALKPCRADYVPKAVNTFRESQDDKAKTWNGITVTIERDGRYSINYRYPK